ncbi:MAG: hypothetical protein AB8C95_10260 [Phycisphaeraceae bacterium]
MDIKATIDTETFGYRNRLLMIALGALLYASWCMYDGLIAYPDQIKAYEAINQVKKDNPEDWKTKWPEVAKANDWDYTKEPNERTQGDITTQWLQFAIVFPIGAYCLFAVGTWSRRYLGVDKTTLYAHGNVEVPFDQITRIDASRWENKGIAKVYYKTSAGEGQVLIDDFKLERQPTDAIFNQIKNAVDPEIIEGLSEEDDAEETDTDEVESPAV